MLGHTLFGSNINDSLGQGPLALTQADDVQLLLWGETLSLCQPLQFMSWFAPCMPTCQSELNRIGVLSRQAAKLCPSTTLSAVMAGVVLSRLF